MVSPQRRRTTWGPSDRVGDRLGSGRQEGHLAAARVHLRERYVAEGMELRILPRDESLGLRVQRERHAERERHALEGAVVARRSEPADGEEDGRSPGECSANLGGDSLDVVAEHDGASDESASTRDLDAQPVGVRVQHVADQDFVARGDDFDERGLATLVAAAVRGD